MPPPALNSKGIPDLRIIKDTSFDYESSGFANAEFLKTVTYGNFITQNNMLEWKYEQRRTAQKVVPFLYLGPMSAAKDKVFLEREAITMVLAVRNTSSAQAKLLESRAAQELGIDSQAIDVSGNQELIAAFPRGIEMINAHLSKQHHLQETRAIDSPVARANPMMGKVLIFCESGNERSAALVAAYLMAMYSMDLLTALQIVQAQRFAVAFDDALRNLLATYQTILRAKRDVFQNDLVGNTQSIEPLHPTKSSKRNFEAAQDEDAMMDDSMTLGNLDADRFVQREGHAPFEDRKAG